MKQLLLFIVLTLVSFHVNAQEIYASRIKGLRVNGDVNDRFPVAGLNADSVSIEFDLDRSQPEDFRIKFYHCEKDWSITQNQFINDEMRNSTKFPIPFEHAPAGVEHYTYHYTLRVPGFPGIEKFAYSGNYIFEIWDKEQTTLLAKGKFFVAEQRIPVSMTIRNRQLPSAGIPSNQVNKIELSITVPDEAGYDPDRIIANLVRTVDIYRNREIGTPYRIDVDDDNPNTFVDGLGTSNLKFIIDNVQPGNEYRHLDLTDVDYYPPNQLSRNRDGADVGRVFHQGPPDNNGASTVLTDSRYSDYIQFQFEFDRESDDVSPMFVVGDFNNWTPSDAWRMSYDKTTQRYVLKSDLRRGVYDYQYVCNGNDWSGVEGNDWRTVNQFTALLYYHDVRFGGFDRIIGFAQQLSPGGTQATAK
jgi:hypothetical protein